MEQADLAVIGAGPAGLEAAITAAEAGASVLLIDGYTQPGGQYFKQLPPPLQADDQTLHHVQAETLFQRLAETGVCLRTSAAI